MTSKLFYHKIVVILNFLFNWTEDGVKKWNTTLPMMR